MKVGLTLPDVMAADTNLWSRRPAPPRVNRATPAGQVLRVSTPRAHSKYEAHDGKTARARRLRQVRRGALKGPVVSEGARYGAHGLVKP